LTLNPFFATPSTLSRSASLSLHFPLLTPCSQSRPLLRPPHTKPIHIWRLISSHLTLLVRYRLHRRRANRTTSTATLLLITVLQSARRHRAFRTADFFFSSTTHHPPSTARQLQPALTTPTYVRFKMCPRNSPSNPKKGSLRLTHRLTDLHIGLGICRDRAWLLLLASD
jgi:hypothetical protein